MNSSIVSAPSVLAAAKVMTSVLVGVQEGEHEPALVRQSTSATADAAGGVGAVGGQVRAGPLVEHLDIRLAGRDGSVDVHLDEAEAALSRLQRDLLRDPRSKVGQPEASPSRG